MFAVSLELLAAWLELLMSAAEDFAVSLELLEASLELVAISLEQLATCSAELEDCVPTSEPESSVAIEELLEGVSGYGSH